MRWHRSFASQLLVLATVISAMHVFALHADHDWGDDFAAYLTNARNLAEGRPYGESGYIFNPQYPTLGPRITPPGFPLLLTPFFFFVGAQLLTLKLVGVGALLGLLVASGYALATFLPRSLVVCAVILIGVHPLVWQLTNQIMSDIPFAALVMLTLWVIMIAEKQPQVRSGQFGLLVGTLMYATTLVRPLGLVLPLALVGYESVRYRTIRRPTLTSIGLLLILLLGQQLFVPNDPTVTQRLPHSLGEVVGNTRELGQRVQALWPVFGDPLATAAAAGVVSILTVSGLVIRWRKSPTLLEYFFIVYLAALVLLAANMHTRYLLPLLPLIIGYALCAVRHCYQWRPWWGVGTAVVSVGMVAGVYLLIIPYMTAPPSPGVASAAAQAMFVYIRTQTEPAALIMFRKPRALYFFTDRRSAVWHRAPDDEILRYFRDSGATYVLTGPAALSWEMTHLVKEYPHDFSHRYTAGEYSLYRFLPTTEYSNGDEHQANEKR